MRIRIDEPTTRNDIERHHGAVDAAIPPAAREDFMHRYRVTAGLAMEALNAAAPTHA